MLALAHAEADGVGEVALGEPIQTLVRVLGDVRARARRPHARLHVDEARRALQDALDALRRRCRRDDEDQRDVVFRTGGFEFGGLLDGEIGDDESGDARVGRGLHERLDLVAVAELEEEVVVGHADDRGVDVEVAHEVEVARGRHPGVERAPDALLNRRTVRDRFAEGKPEFDHVRAALRERLDVRLRRVGARIARDDVRDQRRAVRERRGDVVDAHERNTSMSGASGRSRFADSSMTVSRSLSPRPETLTMTGPSPARGPSPLVCSAAVAAYCSRYATA